jgi:hypothetical protein
LGGHADGKSAALEANTAAAIMGLSMAISKHRLTHKRVAPKTAFQEYPSAFFYKVLLFPQLTRGEQGIYAPALLQSTYLLYCAAATAPRLLRATRITTCIPNTAEPELVQVPLIGGTTVLALVQYKYCIIIIIT